MSHHPGNSHDYLVLLECQQSSLHPRVAHLVKKGPKTNQCKHKVNNNKSALQENVKASEGIKKKTLETLTDS